MLVDIPEANDFQISAENLINSAWSRLTKLLEDHTVFEDIDAKKENIEQYWLYAKPELTAAAAMVQHSVEFYLKAKILSISPYLLISLDARSLPKNSESNDISFSEFRTLDAQDLLKVHNTFASEKLSTDFKAWFNDMRLMRNKIMHTVDKKLSVDPAALAISILQCHEYLVGKNRWIHSRTSFLNRSPEYGVTLGATEEHDSYIHLAIHRELSLVIDSLETSDTKRFFNYDKNLPAEICPYCYKKFAACEYFDSKWTDSFAPTAQPKIGSDGEMECIVCGNISIIPEVECIECGNSAIDKSTRECLWCAIDL